MVLKETHSQGGKQAYQCGHVSFQSTSSYNISTVNSLAQFKLKTQRKVRERRENRREWSIKMNYAQNAYLATYFKIYFMDHIIKNCRVFYQSWEYLHSPMLHAKFLAIVVAYDIYKECVDCGIDS